MHFFTGISVQFTIPTMWGARSEAERTVLSMPYRGTADFTAPVYDVLIIPLIFGYYGRGSKDRRVLAATVLMG
jgi:hypothetical protein